MDYPGMLTVTFGTIVTFTRQDMRLPGFLPV
jgi:hypothetical protein